MLDVLGVPESKVIRCLLASMPPGCVIPVHHDTGHWVRHTHRIHVAVATDVAEVGAELLFFSATVTYGDRCGGGGGGGG